MSDTTNNTSAIDDKKNENTSSSGSLISQIINYIISIVIVLIIIFIYFSSSGLILYLCKLAQSNILPTESNCAPYTDVKPNIQEIKTNIFTTFTQPETSMKLQFPYDKNSKNKVIDMFKEYKNKPSSNFLANYFISITEQLLEFNYSAITVIMNIINNTLTEGLIIGIGPIIGSSLYFIGIIVNELYFIYLWFSNMIWFFKHNSNDSGNGLPKWNDVTLLEPFEWCLGVGLIFLFIFILILGFPIVLFIPLFAFNNSIFSSLLYKGVLNDKTVTVFSIIKDVFKHYKLSVVTTISLFIILLAFSNLGVIPGLFSILAVGLIYWGIISIDTFKPIPEPNLSLSVSYEQAKKTCPNVLKQKHGFIYNLFQQNGGNIAKEIKKAGKIYNNNSH
jgi:hypothetical protein